MARILIVEDDPINAEAAAVICKAARHTVTVVGNGLEALLVLDALPFDLILTDVNMPRMDGITMTGLIRSTDHPYAGIPIIGVTGRSGREDAVRMLASGMDAVVTKPFRAQTLLQAIDRALAHGSEGVTLSPLHPPERRPADEARQPLP